MTDYGASADADALSGVKQAGDAANMTGNIMTVMGPMPAEQLGITHMHEHLIGDCSFSGNDPRKKLDDVDVAIAEMEYFKQAGGQTIVELTCRGLGQNAAALRRIAEESGVNIIAATGFYREVVYPDYVRSETVDELAQRMINDANQGIAGTDVRAGIIAELATENDTDEVSPLEEKVFRAAGRAHLATGLPVSTHCWAGHHAFEQVRLLTDEGVQPDKIVIGHLAVQPGLEETNRGLADLGVNLGIDAIGYGEADGFHDFHDEDRAALAKKLIDWGYLEQITISQDLMRTYHLKSHGGHGYGYLLEKFVPMLHQLGVTAEQIQVLLVDNPRRILTPVGA